MTVRIDRTIPGLRAHCVIDDVVWASNGYSIFQSRDVGRSWESVGQLPISGLKRKLSENRKLARLLRMGISQVMRISDRTILIAADRSFLVSDSRLSEFNQADLDVKSYQVLDHNLCVLNGKVYYGEYFPNVRRGEVRIYRSRDGLEWETIYSFEPGSIKHIHLLQQDPLTGRIWFSTGDSTTECLLGHADADFRDIEVVGKGSPQWRAIELLFEDDRVYWGMDNPCGENWLVSYDPANGTLQKEFLFNGPVYNLMHSNSLYLAITGAEERGQRNGASVHIWCSDGIARNSWSDCLGFARDWLPSLFGYGRLHYGGCLGDTIFLSGSCLRDYDNQIVVLKAER